MKIKAFVLNFKKMLHITLYNYTGKQNKIQKSIPSTGRFACTGVLFSNNNPKYTFPSFLIRYTGSSFFNFNYLYCQEYKRYYYIVEKTPQSNDTFLLNCRLDVLYTYSSLLTANNTKLDLEISSLSTKLRNNTEFYTNLEPTFTRQNFSRETSPFNNNGNIILITEKGNI